jgi:hypothetical protein
MKIYKSTLIILLLFVAGWLLVSRYNSSEEGVIIGGDRSSEGCLISAGYGFSSTIGACVREWEMTPDIMEASRLAVQYLGKGYALTVVAFNSYEEEGAYDIMLEKGEDRVKETVYIRDWKVVSRFIPKN